MSICAKVNLTNLAGFEPSLLVSYFELINVTPPAHTNENTECILFVYITYF